MKNAFLSNSYDARLIILQPTSSSSNVLDIMVQKTFKTQKEDNEEYKVECLIDYRISKVFYFSGT